MREDLFAVAAALLPGEDLSHATLGKGGSHHVVLLPDVAAVRIARQPSAVEALPRRVELLRRLQGVGLPFAVPEPLTDVIEVDGHAAVALSWLSGSPLPLRTQVDPNELCRQLDALRAVDCTALAGLLGEPHEYAGGRRWASVMIDEVIPRLAKDWQDEARRRIDAALALPEVHPSLVHGDLAGENQHWSPAGRLIGVLDWDLAQPFDPAVDAACLAWYGWDTVAAAVGAPTLHRAQTWYRTFGLEQVAFEVLNGASEELVDQRCVAAAAWLERTAKFPSHD